MRARLDARKGKAGGIMLVRTLTAAALTGLLASWSAQATAGPALVFDPQTDAVFYAEDPDALWHPASLTKLMTAYLTFEALRDGKLTLESKINCSENAHAQAPSKIGLPVGAEMSVELALKALLVKSANDVAVMLAEAVAGSEPAFVRRMNEAAQRLGMSRTRFNNPNGLPDDSQVTTARDLAYLARAIIREFPEYASFFALDAVKIGKVRLRNYNSLLRTFDGADGMKTGFICDSGYNVVASATRQGHKLVAVVLGGRTDPERDERASQLLDHGFRRYWWKSMFATKLDSLAMQASLSEEAVSLRSTICSRPRPAKKRTKRRSKPSQANATKSQTR
jgi:D-alanyl-D-alanine carboxypeptidase